MAEDVERIVFCTLAAVYSVLCILCIVVIWYRRVLVDHPKSSGFFISSITVLVLRKFVTLSRHLTFLVRSTFFLLMSNVFKCVPLSVVYLFMTLPAFLQFFTYMSLISIWYVPLPFFEFALTIYKGEKSTSLCIIEEWKCAAFFTTVNRDSKQARENCTLFSL